MNSLKAAFLCGVAPLVVGTLVFFAWLFGGVMWWERAWLWTIGLAIACILAGTIFLLRHLRLQRPLEASWLMPTFAATILLLNLPLGALYMGIVMHVLSRYTVDVRNDSTQLIESFVLAGPGVGPLELGPIDGGQQARKHLYFTADGKLLFNARFGQQQHQGVVEASASPTCNGRKLCRLAPDGTWEIRASD